MIILGRGCANRAVHARSRCVYLACPGKRNYQSSSEKSMNSTRLPRDIFGHLEHAAVMTRRAHAVEHDF